MGASFCWSETEHIVWLEAVIAVRLNKAEMLLSILVSSHRLTIQILAILKQTWLYSSLLIPTVFGFYFCWLLFCKDRLGFCRRSAVLQRDWKRLLACRVIILPLVVILLHSHVLRLFSFIEYLLQLLQNPFLGHFRLVLILSILFHHWLLLLRRCILLLTLLRLIQIMLRLIIVLLLTLLLIGRTKRLMSSCWHILVCLRAIALQGLRQSRSFCPVLNNCVRGSTILTMTHFFIASLVTHWIGRIGSHHAWAASAHHLRCLFVDWIFWMRCWAHPCLSCRLSCLFSHWIWLSLWIQLLLGAHNFSSF